MKKVVLDSDVFINFLKGKSGDFKILLNETREDNLIVFIPAIVLVEIFVGYEFLDNKRLKEAKKFLEGFDRISLTQEIAHQSAKIGRENKLAFLGTADLVIAATAISFNAELATHNVKHFKKVPKLKLFDFQIQDN